MTKLAFKAAPPESVEGCQKVLDGEYDIEGLEVPNPIILDIGANIGSFAMWASERFPDATIFCYEPNPDTFKYLQQNVPAGCKLNCCAVWIADGKMPLYMGLHNVGECSLFTDTGEVDVTKAGIVKVRHARNLPECDIMKLDCEGAEFDILSNYPHLEKCKAVMLEWHGQEQRKKIRDLMISKGFGLVSDQEWHFTRGIQKFVKLRQRHLYVAILSGGGKTWSVNDDCVEALRRVGEAHKIKITVQKDSGTGVDRARNRQIALAMADKTVTHFMFLDDDIVFHPQWVIGMVYSDMDVVAGAYPRKQINWEMIEAAVKRGVPAKELALHSSDWIINQLVRHEGGGFEGYTVGGVGEFVEVEEIGTGFMMVKREAIEKVIDAYGPETAYIADYPPMGEVHHMVFACQRDPKCPREARKAALLEFARQLANGTAPPGDKMSKLTALAWDYGNACKTDESLGRYLTEDYAFCRLWRMLGGKIYLYLDAEIAHLGNFMYEGSIRQYLKAEPASENNESPNLGSPTGNS